MTGAAVEIDQYDCSGKPDGNYLHPSDCTRYVQCTDGVATQQDCPPCELDAFFCPDGRLTFSPEEDACLWANETECHTADDVPDVT